jgi:hypothetical protein
MSNRIHSMDCASTGLTTRNVAAYLICLALLGGCDNGDRQVESQAQNSGEEWIVLFNGENLDGWRRYGESAPGSNWIVEDGAIVLDVDATTSSTTGGDLMTADQYENFELQLEWKISTGGNSGIFFGVQEIAGQRVAYETGIEMQILDDDRHADGARRETSAGSCYALYPPTADVVRPVGEYNDVRIVVRDSHVEHWLNGVMIVEYTIGSADWTDRVAASKFADWQHFARYRKGHIALQDHTDRVWFRNIRIRQL